MLKAVAGALCAYELGSLATGCYPTLTQLSARHRWLGPVLAVHLYCKPGPQPRIIAQSNWKVT